MLVVGFALPVARNGFHDRGGRRVQPQVGELDGPCRQLQRLLRTEINVSKGGVSGEETRNKEETRDEEATCQPNRIGLDSGFFEDLSRTYASSGRRPKPQPLPSTMTPHRLLTIQVDLLGVKRRGPHSEKGRR